MGKIATHIQEIHCLVASDLLYNKCLNDLTKEELVGLFSIFASIRVGDNKKTFGPKNIKNKNISQVAEKIERDYDYYFNEDCHYRLDLVNEYELNFIQITKFLNFQIILK